MASFENSISNSDNRNKEKEKIYSIELDKESEIFYGTKILHIKTDIELRPNEVYENVTIYFAGEYKEKITLLGNKQRKGELFPPFYIIGKTNLKEMLCKFKANGSISNNDSNFYFAAIQITTSVISRRNELEDIQ